MKIDTAFDRPGLFLIPEIEGAIVTRSLEQQSTW